MKNQFKSLYFAATFFIAIPNAFSTETPEKIGDHLDLHAVLETFKQSKSVEAFEQELNNEASKINNLDLNEDNEVDYIQVMDYAEKDVHAIVLRVALSESEAQDVAVIELEKTAAATAQIQIVGDEALYGENYIIEPYETKTVGNMPPAVIAVNVWAWPSVRFIYGPNYRPWRSTWRWRKHPVWWRPWRPIGWNAYRGYHVRHRNHFHVVTVRRGTRSGLVYRQNRRTCKRTRNHSLYHRGSQRQRMNRNAGTKKVQKQRQSQVRSNGNKTQKRQRQRTRRR